MGTTLLTFSCDVAEAVRRGVNCPIPPAVQLPVDLTQVDPADLVLLAARINEKGQILRRDTERGNLTWQIIAPEPTLAGLLEAVRANEAAYQEQQQYRREQAEAEIVGYCSRDVDRGLRKCYEGVLLTWSVIEYVGAYYASMGLSDPRVAARQALLAAEAKRRNEEAQRERAEQEERARQERSEWIAAHGSARLKRLAAEGIGHEKTYTSERTAWEANQEVSARQAIIEEQLPGWFPLGSAAQRKELVAPVADVGVRTLALLDAARAMAPSVTVTLGKLINGCDGVDAGRIIAVAEIEGRLFGWPRD